MSTMLPFTISREAADYLRQRLQDAPCEQEPALITALAVGEGGGDAMRFWYEGEHFMIGYYNPGQRPQAQHIELFGRQVSIVPETLQRLSGRTLVVEEVVERCGWFRKTRRSVLVTA